KPDGAISTPSGLRRDAHFLTTDLHANLSVGIISPYLAPSPHNLMAENELNPQSDTSELLRGIADNPEEAVRWFLALPAERRRKLFDQFTDSGKPEAFENFGSFAEMLVAEAPNDPAGYFFRALFRYHRNEEETDRDSALDDLDKVKRLGGKWPEIEIARLWCEQGLGLYEEQVDTCTRLLQTHPTDKWVWFFRGEALLGLGDAEAALKDFDTAERLGMKSAQIFEQRARAWNTLDEPERCAAAAAEIFCHAPQPAYGGGNYHGLGHFFDSIGQPEVGLAAFGKALELEPDSTHHLGCRSNLLFNMGRDDEAEADQDRIAEINSRGEEMADKTLIYPLVMEHFREAPLEALSVTDRQFPPRVAADLQRAFDRLPEAGFTVVAFHATQQHGQAVRDFNQVYTRDRRNPVVAVPPKFMEIDIGEDEPIRALRDGLWLLKTGDEPLCVFMFGEYNGPMVVVAGHNTPAGTAAVHKFYKHMEDAIAKSECYRGKVLSLEYKEMYNGQALGLMVHKIKKVQREEVILPKRTLDLLDRNVMGFVKQRPALSKLGLAVKKGLLFYGPPGTGKTHTIHYLSGTIPEHTTFIISAEQVANLSEYMTLARLLQPSMVVIEDVDLIARDRAEMRSAGEEVMLNKLLNEMDGLKADSEILFVLTTNRPETLESALAARPGRVDQAIEYPLPDAEGRSKLARLYSQGVPMTDSVQRNTVDRTDKVTASFIKELMRRAIQHAIVRDGGELAITQPDVDAALEEMLVTGGALNRKLLGAHALTESDSGA
ncbi:MAG: AAA family ATPase, partial [Planctomycetia bacterium]|nr:AAA family ATPase [Planctomycetia bacterium]